MAAINQKFEAFKARLDKVLHEKNKVTDVLEIIEQKTGVRRLYVALGFIAFIALYLMIGFGAQFLCNFIGFIYPAYASVKAIESHEKDDDTKWLTYWVVYSVFSLVEFFSDIFLFWIPFYWFLKCVFLVWCFLPVSWNGSHILYYRFIRPFILRHQDRIDSALHDAKEAVTEVFNLSTLNEKDIISHARDLAGELAHNEAVNRIVNSAKTD
ncbi:unnamed protein product [Candidula unifasciata]|uniref:Receptor expression-enhancing protein n=1 Tax=Candidula unifasciata TaxID=100452 RepID=A0A8S4AAW1_9EUPU|nr:unnamed protein product [Candidula unifasciata]